MFLLRLLTALALGGAITTCAAPVFAQSRSAPEVKERFLLVAHAPASRIDIEALRQRIENDTGSEVRFAETQATGKVITVSIAGDELTISVDRDGTNISRVLPASSDPAANLRVAALTITSLLRHAPSQTNPTSEPPPATELQAPAPLPVNAAERSVETRPLEPETQPAVASFFFPLATNIHTPETHTFFAFNLLYGRVGSVEGGELGLVNVVTEKMEGLQLGLAANVVGDRAEGVQAAWLFNVAKHGADGLQLAAVNVAGENSSVFQVGGLNLHTKGELEGAQIGLLNVGQRVKGLQLGLVNVAEEATVPIGIVSVSKDGGVHPTVFGGYATALSFGVKLAAKHTYTLFHLSLDPIRGDRVVVEGKDSGLRFGWGGAIGLRIPITEKLKFEADLGLTYLCGGALMLRPEGGSRGDLFQSKLRFMLTFAFEKHLSLLAGAGPNVEVRVRNEVDDPTVVLRPDVFLGAQF